jgi:hypothetical protein
MPMIDIVIYRAGSPWATPLEDAMLAGLRAHGIAPEVRNKGDWRASDLAVVWAHRDTALHAMQREAGQHYLVMERGFVGDIHARREWTSLGFDGLNGRAKRPTGMPADRWDAHFGGVMRPWKSGGDYAVVMGQTRGDAALVGVDIVQWYAAAALCLAQIWGLPVLFRPHPADPTSPGPRGVAGDTGELAACLAGAAMVATFNSTAAVQAVLAGVPTIAMDRGSMAYEVTAHDWGHRATPDRRQWAADLAYAQWRAAEIADGTAWDHLKQVLTDDADARHRAAG